MYYFFRYIFVLFFGLSMLFSCQTENNTDFDAHEIQPMTHRAQSARAMSIESILIKLPKKTFQAEGWENISTKELKSLLNNGNLNALKATINEQKITIEEQFQNEDDENERAAKVEIIVFRHIEDDYNIVYIGQKYIHENKHYEDEPISNTFWKFDGRSWKNIDNEIPSITTATFFEDSFALDMVEKDHIMISPNTMYNNALTATLAYEQYKKYGLTPEVLVSNEHYHVNLIWNGKMFELQRKPATIVE